MTADSLFPSDAEIESIDLDVSDDSKDSIISVEKEIITTQGEPVALVYPFVAGLDIENACKGLHLGEENTKFSSSHILLLQQEKVAPRSHFITMHQADFARLNPGQYLNDSVVDFWLQWITRKEANEDPYIMYFNTQFYSAILLTGVSCVIKWNEKRGVDIFSKKILVIPVNMDNHWSLCAVYNAAQIAKLDKKDGGSVDIPFIMFLDPLDFHSQIQVCQNIRDWLNAEWNNKYKK
jgi:Ulp1 family protease